ncbi:MAG: hypothetical protein OXJ64_20275, partial [Boseongicola sp.]|nr:hypothetical protein [Boseongicola sp.]
CGPGLELTPSTDATAIPACSANQQLGMSSAVDALGAMRELQGVGHDRGQTGTENEAHRKVSAVCG